MYWDPIALMYLSIMTHLKTPHYPVCVNQSRVQYKMLQLICLTADMMSIQIYHLIQAHQRRTFVTLSKKRSVTDGTKNNGSAAEDADHIKG